MADKNKSFNILIVALSPSYIGDISHQLMRRGMKVSYMGQGTLTAQGSPACMITLTVEGDPRSSKEISNDAAKSPILAIAMREVVRKAIADTAALFYALIVKADDGSMAWVLGNINTDKIEADRKLKEEEEIAAKVRKEIDEAISIIPDSMPIVQKSRGGKSN